MIEGLTTGRVVHYHPAAYDSDLAKVSADDCLAATVAYVWSRDTGTVNLCVLDANGVPHSKTSIQHADFAPGGCSSWHWPERA